MNMKKSKVREAIDSLKKLTDAIIWLKNEMSREPHGHLKLYTREEKKALYNIKKDIIKFKKRDSD